MILTAQSLAVLIFGWITRIIIRLKYNTPTSDYQLFDCSNYNLRPDFDNSKFPKNSLVLVRFNSDRTIKSEQFYTHVGDWIYVEYENGRKVNSTINAFSTLILLPFYLPGAFIIVALNILDLVQFFFDIDPTSLPKFLNMDIAKLSLMIPWYCTIIQYFFSPLFRNEHFNNV
jgi:hypothetical protein